MKKDIIKALEDLSSHESAKHEKGFQFKTVMYRKAIKAFKETKIDIKTQNDITSVLRSVFKKPGINEKKTQRISRHR